MMTIDQGSNSKGFRGDFTNKSNNSSAFTHRSKINGPSLSHSDYLRS